ncbi:hypothetical protein E2C01_077944 [Portunus trituberculatus]|uniref:Uncharacterized protein n=1 Tax=Portunus trituberculatus TaxID=210409 RepID=A0A5B7IFQ8_PORTR|nr:hypothetical protein [Portunus trituberculatus]
MENKAEVRENPHLGGINMRENRIVIYGEPKTEANRRKLAPEIIFIQARQAGWQEKDEKSEGKGKTWEGQTGRSCGSGVTEEGESWRREKQSKLGRDKWRRGVASFIMVNVERDWRQKIARGSAAGSFIPRSE